MPGSAPPPTPEIELTVNGRARRARRDPERSLLGVLRGEFGLTGSKFGCGEGECGACTVLLDGRPVHACQTAIEEAEGRAVTTVEGLATGGVLHPVQRAFADLGAFQCGYCTPGMVVRAAALLAENPAPSEPEIRAALEGNVCRCGGYSRILRAVELAAERSRAAARRTP